MAFTAEIGDEEPVQEAVIVDNEEVHKRKEYGVEAGWISVGIKSTGCAIGFAGKMGGGLRENTQNRQNFAVPIRFFRVFIL